MIGSLGDLFKRIKSLLPGGWFGESPVIDGVVTGIARLLSDTHAFIVYARDQTRIRTATDGFLDLIARDFFGSTLKRRTGEIDPPLRQRILAQLFAEKVTRRGVIKALESLTGRTPLVFEPTRPADTGGYNTNSLGYGVAGGYGSLALPFQAFITAYRPAGQGIPLVAGYGSPSGGLLPHRPRASYASLNDVVGAVTDQDIYAAIDAAAKPVGTTFSGHAFSLNFIAKRLNKWFIEILVYAGEIPLDDAPAQHQPITPCVGLGEALKATLGTGTTCDGLAVTATTPASLAVLVAPWGDLLPAKPGRLRLRQPRRRHRAPDGQAGAAGRTR